MKKLIKQQSESTQEAGPPPFTADTHIYTQVKGNRRFKRLMCE